jgi:hypothetical protein
MTLTHTAKLNRIDAQAWLTDVLEHIIARQIKVVPCNTSRSV